MATRATTSRSDSPRKIFIVEDHPVFREGLVQVLEREAGLTVCGEAGDARQALRAINRLKPDLVLVDITLPGKSGLELIREIRATNRKIKLLVVSMHDEAVYASRVLRAGGDGYVMKQVDTDEIVHAVHDVLNGHIYVSEEVLASLGKPEKSEPKRRRTTSKTRLLTRLSDAELEILELLGLGKTHREIARRIHSNSKQVEARCTQMAKKLNVKNINELIRFAVCWVETESQ